jgi:tRNA(Ile)-lysidine synthase
VGPTPDVAAVRTAVRASLAGLDPGALVLVACSGGADSLALAAGTTFVAPRVGLRAGAVTVDHGLQPGSADRARAVGATCRRLGLDPVEVVGVGVPDPPGPAGGPEGAARTARLAALAGAAARHGAAAVLLGHTRDDQAETVLLGLARGSGPRSIAGMRPVDGLLRRPLLDLPRASTRAACADLGLEPWDDPHNRDPAYARARVRAVALPALEGALGPGVAAALARSGALARDDADALDAIAAHVAADLTAPDGSLDVAELAALPRAVRTRVLRGAVLAAGCRATALTKGHVDAVDRLVTGWRGQLGVALPGDRRAVRERGRISVRTPDRGP